MTTTPSKKRRWWLMKRTWLLGLIALSFAEGFLIDYLVARQMENHVDFDARYAELLKQPDLYGSRILRYEKQDVLGYTHITYFSKRKRSNAISYLYQRPVGYFSIADMIDSNSDKRARMIVDVIDEKIRKFKFKEAEL